MNPTLLALIICLAAAALEGALAGRAVRQRLAELRMPRYSPSFSLWIVIGVLYYAICFVVLRHLLSYTPSSPGPVVALVLLAVVLLANAFWSVVFFRWRDLRASFVCFIPYAVVVAALVASLTRLYPLGAVAFACYGCYLVYAAWWGYHLWRLNTTDA
ncbi:MAG: tryptophan-rich sensory protein [Chthoniobacterales bacterium]|nr:tryptophan-rich sensory protein [Chthoniobacterales bacterium]